jgi:hypothetical protein
MPALTAAKTTIVSLPVGQVINITGIGEWDFIALNPQGGQIDSGAYVNEDVIGVYTVVASVQITAAFNSSLSYNVATPSSGQETATASDTGSTSGGTTLDASNIYYHDTWVVNGGGTVTLAADLASSGRKLAFVPGVGQPDFTIALASGPTVIQDPGTTLSSSEADARTVIVFCQADGVWRVESVRGAEAFSRQFGAPQTAQTMSGAWPVISAPFSASNYVVSLGSPTVTIEAAPSGKTGIKIVTGVGVTAELTLPDLQAALYYGDVVAALEFANSTPEATVAGVAFYIGTAGYSGFNVDSYFPSLAALNQSENLSVGQSPVVFRAPRETTTVSGTWVSTPPTFPIVPGAAKIRITPVAGQSATVWLHGVGMPARRKKGRICVIWDDGYASTMQLGAPLFSARGIKQTISIISSTIGLPGYTSEAQLREFLAAGNAVVPHGPLPNSGIGNLFTAYPGSPDPIASAMADVLQTRDELGRRGLLAPGAGSCYVWPQGVWQQTLGQATLLQKMYDEGFRVGRCAQDNTARGFRFNELSKYRRLTLPILGKAWQGSTAAEAANIAAINTAIANFAQRRDDMCLMLHRAVVDSVPDGSMNQIATRVSDLTSMASAIEAQISAGNLESVTMPELMAAGDGFWGTF